MISYKEIYCVIYHFKINISFGEHLSYYDIEAYVWSVWSQEMDQFE